MDRFEVVSIGELLYVLRATQGSTLDQARTLSCHISGSEANVAVGLSALGTHVGFFSKVPGNFMGRRATDTLRGLGVDTEGIVRADAGRMGIIFQEFGLEGRASESIYDRRESAFTRLEEDEIDWERFRQAKRFLSTGITAAVGPGPLRVLKRAIREAKDADMQVVFDCNYRSKLWPATEARQTIEPMLPDVDLLFITKSDAETVFDLTDAPESAAARLREHYGINLVVVTLGAAGALAHDGRSCHVPAFDAHVVNRFGMGDAFVAGFLYGTSHHDLPTALKYGHALAALKGTRIDENYSTFRLEEIEHLIRTSQVHKRDTSPPDVIR